jgi:hypothetical protein
LLQAFPSPMLLGECCCSSLRWLTCLFTLCMGSAPPTLSRAQGTLPSLLHVFFFFQLLVYYSVWFFPFFSLGRGQSVQEAMLICPRVLYGSTVCCLFAYLRFCQAGSELASGGTGALLVYPFNVEWGCYAWAGGVEVSEFCLFLVVFSCKVYLQHLSKILL